MRGNIPPIRIQRLQKHANKGAKSNLANPLQPKKRLALETLLQVSQTYISEAASLAKIRLRFVLLSVGCAGLFRISE